MVDVPDDALYRSWVRSWFSSALDVLGHALGLRYEHADTAQPDELPDSSHSAVVFLARESLVMGERSQRRAFSSENLDWLCDAAVAGHITRCEAGWGRLRDFFGIKVWRDDTDRSWAQFILEVPEEHLRSAVGRSVQEAVLRVLRELAEVSNPVFGAFGYGDLTGTEFEHCTESYGAWDAYPTARRYLRGYGWLTVVPTEVVERLGGVAGLEAGGSFVEVSGLAGGGAWLRAGMDFFDYDLSSAGGVFQAVAAALRPGMPGVREELGVPAPRTPVVLQDAADYGAQ